MPLPPLHLISPSSPRWLRMVASLRQSAPHAAPWHAAELEGHCTLADAAWPVPPSASSQTPCPCIPVSILLPSLSLPLSFFPSPSRGSVSQRLPLECCYVPDHFAPPACPACPVLLAGSTTCCGRVGPVQPALASRPKTGSAWSACPACCHARAPRRWVHLATAA